LKYNANQIKYIKAKSSIYNLNCNILYDLAASLIRGEFIAYSLVYQYSFAFVLLAPHLNWNTIKNYSEYK